MVFIRFAITRLFNLKYFSFKIKSGILWLSVLWNKQTLLGRMDDFIGIPFYSYRLDFIIL